MAYKMIDWLEKLCGRVAGAAMQHRALITNALAERFRHKLPPEQTVPDVFQLQTWLAEELDELHARVIASEKGLKAELTEDRQDREERGRYVSEVRQHLFTARSVFDAMYGAGGSDVFFQEQSSWVRVDPVPLHRQGITVHDNILNPDFRRPLLRYDLEVNLEGLARGMEPSLDGLRSKLSGLHTSTQGSNALLAAKETDMAELDRRIGAGARLLEALYVWAEHEGLASRVRLSSHRAANAAAAGDSEAEAEDAEDAEDVSPETEPPPPPEIAN